MTLAPPYPSPLCLAYRIPYVGRPMAPMDLTLGDFLTGQSQCYFAIEGISHNGADFGNMLLLNTNSHADSPMGTSYLTLKG